MHQFSPNIWHLFYLCLVQHMPHNICYQCLCKTIYLKSISKLHSIWHHQHGDFNSFGECQCLCLIYLLFGQIYCWGNHQYPLASSYGDHGYQSCSYFSVYYRVGGDRRKRIVKESQAEDNKNGWWAVSIICSVFRFEC